MFVGRFLGWSLLALAVLMASADAVMALGPADYAGIVTAEMLMLLTGDEPTASASLSVVAALEQMILDLPAWVVVGAAGVGLVLLCRRRPRRHRYRNAFA